MEPHCMKQLLADRGLTVLRDLISRPRSAFSAAMAFAAFALALAVSACGVQASVGTPAAGGGRPAAAAPVRQAGACLDGTSSSAAYYATRFQAMLADAVAAWAPRRPAGPGGGAPVQPGLHFVLRSVTTTSVSTDVPSVDGTVPPVGSLPASPSPTSASFDSAIHSWTDAQSAWERASAGAAAGAQRLAGTIRRYQVVRGTYSAIYNCLTAAQQQLGTPSGADTRLAVMSDMRNNEPVVGLRLRGAAVLVAAICPADVATTCAQRFAAARRYLLRHGASSVQMVLADAVTPQTFDQFWRA